MSARYDAIVIGAGVGGATAAILLAQQGWSVAIVEKQSFPRRKVCGECIAAPNLELLEALGLASPFEAVAGASLERVALYCGDDVLTTDMPALRGSEAPWGRALGRERLDTMLLARAVALGAHVWQPWRAVDVVRHGSMHACTVRQVSAQRGTAVLKASVIIDAHGSWERAPAAAGRKSPAPRDSDLLAFKANFAGAQLEPGLLPVLAFDGGYGGLVVADDGRLTIACCVRRDRLRAWRARMPDAAAGAAVEALLTGSCGGLRDALLGTHRIGPWIGAGPIRPGVRAVWTEGRGFAVGNAAGEAHPILGEGISMAMQGAWLLCAHLVADRDALLRGRSQGPVARGYARDWRRAFAGRIRWAALFATLAMRPRAARVLRPLLHRRPELLTLGAVLGGKVRRPQPARTRARVEAQP